MLHTLLPIIGTRSVMDDAAAEIDLSLLSGANATFIAEMSRAWQADQNLCQKWNAYFQAFGDLAQAGDDIEAGQAGDGNKTG